MNLAGDLKASIAKMIKDVMPITVRVVSAVGADGTVNLGYGDMIIEGVPCSQAYTDRQIGDNVWVGRLPGGNYEVLFKSGVNAPDVPITQGDLTEQIDELDRAIRNDIPSRVRVVWQTGAPAGTGWKLASNVYVRDDGNGARAIAFDVADPGTPSIAPASAPLTPRSALITPDAHSSWRTNGQIDATTVYQGGWETAGDWLGAWFYGARIRDACAGKEVASMSLRLTREAGYGYDRAVQVRLALHDRTTLGKPILREERLPFRLEPGETRLYQLPPDWVNDLLVGTARGFGVSGVGQDEYIRYGGDSGAVTIRFDAS